MKHVRIADLKARLSEHLRAVRRGETITVFDRDTLVAHIVPATERITLRVRRTSPGTPPPNRVPIPGPKSTGLDVVHLLLEERRGSR